MICWLCERTVARAELAARRQLQPRQGLVVPGMWQGWQARRESWAPGARGGVEPRGGLQARQSGSFRRREVVLAEDVFS